MKGILAVLAAFLFLAMPPAGRGAGRIALVIGNGAYRHVDVLANPVHDAKAFAARLEAAGYAVTRIEDGEAGKMVLETKRFARAASKADLAAFFFAGHGIEVKGQNYLIPVDAKLEIDVALAGEEADLALDFALERETLPLEQLMDELDQASRGLKLIVLDCCRNNPYAKSRAWARKRSGSTGGLAEVAEEALPDGTMLVFSGEPGKGVPDGRGDHSPFTAALLAEIEAAPDLPIMKLFAGVSRRIESDQKPWMKLDGTGQSVAAFMEVPLLTGDAASPTVAMPGGPAPGGPPGVPEPSVEALAAELAKAQAEAQKRENDARMAAEIEVLKQKLAEMESRPQPPPADPGPGRTAQNAQWVIACESEEDKASADRAAARWASRGFDAGVLWIPEYSSLSGKHFWLVFVGPWPYEDRESVKGTLQRVRPLYGDAYGIKVDQSGKREVIP